MAPPLSLDFETRSPLDVRDVGAYVYARHPETQILCYAATWGDYRAVSFDPNNPPEWLAFALSRSAVEIHAFNASFERQIIEAICVPRHGWHRPTLGRYRCSAARARRMALPGSLEGAGEALRLPLAQLKDKEGTRIMRRLTKPLPTRKGSSIERVYDDDPDKLAALGRYCLQDVDAEMAVAHHTFDLPEREQAFWETTERMNDRGIRIDLPLVKRLVWRAAEAVDELNERLDKITNGKVTALTQVARLKDWIEAETGTVLDSLGKEHMDAIIDHRDFPPHVVEALKIRQEGAKSSVAKLTALLDRVSEDGRLRGAFVYHGASTGRYTSKGVQFQNLIRDTHKDFDTAIERLDEFSLTDISKTIRQTIIPDPGNVFIDADYNAVEARGVGWLFGAKRLLAIYRRGGDPYCEMGSVIYGFPVTAENETERFVGKQTILGCGYGMGPPKFHAQCERFNTPVEMDVAEKAVGAYREEFDEIPDGWREMTNASIAAVRNPGKVVSAANGKIKFCFRRGYLQMMLPSGRPLFYKNPRVAMVDKWGSGREQPELSYEAEHPTTKQWVRETTWGGKLTENAVQAICRDLLFEATLQLEGLGIPAVMSVHDQGVFEVREEMADWACKVVKQVLEATPNWAEGFPLKAEPKITRRFGK